MIHGAAQKQHGSEVTQPTHLRVVRGDPLDEAIDAASSALLRLQRPDGHWAFELEADATIPAEYVLLQHYLGEIDDRMGAKIGVYLRRIQGVHGGWPLFHGGPMDLS